jgi:hypothetical protein
MRNYHGEIWAVGRDEFNMILHGHAMQQDSMNLGERSLAWISEGNLENLADFVFGQRGDQIQRLSGLQIAVMESIFIESISELKGSRTHLTIVFGRAGEMHQASSVAFNGEELDV